MLNMKRLHLAIAAACPIEGVSLLSLEGVFSPANVRISYASSATAEQMAAAQAALEAYDGSPEADAQWEVLQARQNAGTALLTDREVTAVATRANAHATWIRINDLAEANYAALQLICERSGVNMPSSSEIATKIAENRTLAGQDFQFPTAAQTADQGLRRISELEIMTLVQTILLSGIADPQWEVSHARL